MWVAVLVAKREGAHDPVVRLDLRRFDAGHQLVAAVASYLFLVNELDDRSRRQFVERLTVAEGAFQSVDDRLGQIVELSRGTEAAVDLKCDAYAADVVFNEIARGADNTGAQSVLPDLDIRVKLVSQVAQVAGFGVFVEDQRVTLFHLPGVGGLLKVIGPAPCFRGIQPGVLEVIQNRRRMVKGQLDDDRVRSRRCAIGKFRRAAVGSTGLQIHQRHGRRGRLASLEEKMNRSDSSKDRDHQGSDQTWKYACEGPPNHRAKGRPFVSHSQQSIVPKLNSFPYREPQHT